MNLDGTETVRHLAMSLANRNLKKLILITLTKPEQGLFSISNATKFRVRISCQRQSLQCGEVDEDTSHSSATTLTARRRTLGSLHTTTHVPFHVGRF